MAQENSAKSGGWLSVFAVIIAISIGAAAYFAHYENAQFPGSEMIRTITQKIPENSGNEEYTHDEARMIPNPAQRHLELKQLMLRQTNQERTKYGVPPVRLGTNPAAQIHAEESLKGCYSSHWDRWGLKPNHRYTLNRRRWRERIGTELLHKTGPELRTQRPNGNRGRRNRPSLDGKPGTPKKHSEPRPHSPERGHRLRPIQLANGPALLIGLRNLPSQAFHRQHRILRLEATSDRATFNIADAVNIQISYDPPARNLSRGQLAHTYALCNGRVVGWIAKPLTGGAFYLDHASRDPGTSLRGPIPHQPPQAGPVQPRGCPPGLGKCKSPKCSGTAHNHENNKNNS